MTILNDIQKVSASNFGWASFILTVDFRVVSRSLLANLGIVNSNRLRPVPSTFLTIYPTLIILQSYATSSELLATSPSESQVTKTRTADDVCI
jgi:hypothetical protein